MLKKINQGWERIFQGQGKLEKWLEAGTVLMLSPLSPIAVWKPRQRKTLVWPQLEKNKKEKNVQKSHWVQADHGKLEMAL